MRCHRRAPRHRLRWAPRHPWQAGAAAAVAAALAAGCGPAVAAVAPARAGSRVLQVVAAENVWGSIAAQLGGPRVAVRDLVSDPNADPHEHEATASDARAVADADVVIVDGAGYDDWAATLLGAGATRPGREVVRAARVVGVRAGANPHLWYDPADVEAVATAITGAYTRADPAARGWFRARRAAFERALGPYHAAITRLRRAYAGRPIGATESVVAPLAAALGLRLVSPPALMQAVSEGNDPPVRAVGRFEDQIARRAIAVLVYNRQTATAVTTGLEGQARRAGIPVVGITETIVPPGRSFEAWQVGQLDALGRALARAGRR